MLGRTNLPLSELFPYGIDVYKEQYIRIVSNDGYTLVVNKRAAIQSDYFKKN